MNNKAYCFHIQFDREARTNDDSFLPTLKQLVYEKAYWHTPLLHDLTITDEDTLSDLDRRLESILKDIKFISVIKRIKKYKPREREGRLLSWHIAVEVLLNDPATPKFSNSYRIGRVCRSIQGENILCFFDEYGFLYLIDKRYNTSYPLYAEEGEAILFGISWARKKVSPEESAQQIIEYDTSNKENRPLESSFEIENTIIEYSLFNEFIPFKAIPESVVNYSKRTSDKSLKHFFYKKEKQSFSFYNGFQTGAHSSTYAESVLLKYLSIHHPNKTIVSSLKGFQQTYNNIAETINKIDIQKVLSSYSVLEDESRIVNYYDETHVDVTPHLETEDPYLLSLFPMKKDSYIGDYKYGQELKNNCHDLQKERNAIKNAKVTYSPQNHHSYLLYDTMHPIIEDLVLEIELNNYWPLRFFNEIVSRVPIDQLSDFINKHNRLLSAHSNVEYNFVNCMA